MDTRTANKTDVRAEIERIKTHMPQVYQSIQDWAEEIGNVAFTMVRRGLRGEPNCFYAFEQRGRDAGYLVGTPFNLPEITDVTAGTMVRWGSSLWVMRGPVADIEKDGA